MVDSARGQLIVQRILAALGSELAVVTLQMATAATSRHEALPAVPLENLVVEGIPERVFPLIFLKKGVEEPVCALPFRHGSVKSPAAFHTFLPGLQSLRFHGTSDCHSGSLSPHALLGTLAGHFLERRR
jgi:hypothetical protein